MFLRLTHTNTQRTAEGDRERGPHKGVSERERESAVAVGVLMRALHTLCQIPNRACQKRMFSLSLSLSPSFVRSLVLLSLA